MGNILICNIGNRNITYKDKVLDKDTFRYETEKIWNIFDEVKENVKIQIITNHIDDKIKKIILIVTDQVNPEYNNQDTLFEGKILKLLLKEQYNIEVEIETYSGNPTNEDEIFPYYSLFLRKFISNNEFSRLIFNDAGGTPQMKLVVKELFEYYLPPERFQIVYSDQKDAKRIVERIYKSKYILLKTAGKFVNEFNYSAANRILEEIPNEAGVTDNLFSLISIAAKRINFELEGILQFLRKNDDLRKKFKVVFNHLVHKIPPDNAISFDQIKKEFRLSIFELASICQLYFSTKNYTLAVATYYRLVEEFLHRFAHSYGKYKLSSVNERVRFVNENFEELKIEYANFSKNEELKPSYGLTLLALYAYMHGDEYLKKLVKLFLETISMFRRDKTKGIDLLRNKCFLAHKNEAVTEDSINNTEPEFLNRILPDIFKCLNMPEENIYYSMNRLINKEMLNN